MKISRNLELKKTTKKIESTVNVAWSHVICQVRKFFPPENHTQVSRTAVLFCKCNFAIVDKIFNSCCWKNHELVWKEIVIFLHIIREISLQHRSVV